MRAARTATSIEKQVTKQSSDAPGMEQALGKPDGSFAEDLVAEKPAWLHVLGRWMRQLGNS